MRVHQKRSRRRTKRRAKQRAVSRRAVLIGASIGGVAVAAHFLFRRGADDRKLRPGSLIPAVNLQFAGAASVQHAGDVAASLNDKGLQITLRPGGTDIDAVAEVMAGHSTFGVMSAIRFMLARERGVPIVAFGAEFLDSPVAFFSLDAAKINSPSDFQGLRIPRRQGSDAAIIYDAVLANLGISRGAIKEKDEAGSVSMLLDRSIDVLPGELAATSYVLKRMGTSYTVLRPADFGIHVPGSVYFTTEAALRDHPSVVGAFLQQVISGWKGVYAGGSEIAQVVASAAGVPSDQVEFELKAQRNLVLPVERRIAEYDDLQWKQLRIMLLQERLVREETEFSAAVDYSILRDVYRPPLSYGQ